MLVRALVENVEGPTPNLLIKKKLKNVPQLLTIYFVDTQTPVVSTKVTVTNPNTP
jgi:hypothetical protein